MFSGCSQEKVLTCDVFHGKMAVVDETQRKAGVDEVTVEDVKNRTTEPWAFCWAPHRTGVWCERAPVEVPPDAKMPMCAEHAVQYRQARGQEVPEGLLEKARMEK